jgi:predicted RNase H-like nuclease
MRTHGRHGLRTLGVDLAWADATTANETGVVAAESDGTIVDAGWTTGVEETVAWANTHATDAAVLFVDAPLVVLNADKQRLCEAQDRVTLTNARRSSCLLPYESGQGALVAWI